MKNNVPPVGWPPAFPASLREAAVAPPESSPERAACRPVAFHEAAHCIAGRYLGFEIGIATIIPSRHFGGAVRGPGCDIDETPADIIADARSRCEEAMALMPRRGESREDCAPWTVHATSRCIELLAGKEGEGLSGFDCEGGAATDMALANIYADSVCVSAGAVAAFIDYCRCEAREILKTHWHAVEAVAGALQEHQTLDGAEIDTIIFAAEANAAHEAEIIGRRRMAAMAGNAARFHGQ